MSKPLCKPSLLYNSTPNLHLSIFLGQKEKQDSKRVKSGLKWLYTTLNVGKNRKELNAVIGHQNKVLILTSNCTIISSNHQFCEKLGCFLHWKMRANYDQAYFEQLTCNYWCVWTSTLHKYSKTRWKCISTHTSALGAEGWWPLNVFITPS